MLCAGSIRVISHLSKPQERWSQPSFILVKLHFFDVFIFWFWSMSHLKRRGEGGNSSLLVIFFLFYPCCQQMSLPIHADFFSGLSFCPWATVSHVVDCSPLSAAGLAYLDYSTLHYQTLWTCILVGTWTHSFISWKKMCKSSNCQMVEVYR